MTSITAQKSEAAPNKTAISDDQMKCAPEDDLSRALLASGAGNARADQEADIARLEGALAHGNVNDPWASKAFYQIGSAQFALEEYQQALSSFQACLRLPEPHSGVHLYAQQMRMLTLERLGRDKEAIVAADALIKTPAPDFMKADLESRAILLKAQWQEQLPKKQGGGFLAAAKTYKDFLQRMGKHTKDSSTHNGWTKFSPFALRSLGEALDRGGKAKQANDVYSAYLTQYPSRSDSSLVATKKLVLMHGGFGKVLPSEYAEVIKKYSVNTGAGQYVQYDLGFTLFSQGKYIEAAHVLAGMSGFKPSLDDHEYSRDLAAKAELLRMHCLALGGNTKQAEALAKQIMQTFNDLPASDEARAALAGFVASDKVATRTPSIPTIRFIALISMFSLVALAAYKYRRSRVA